MVKASEILERLELAKKEEVEFLPTGFTGLDNFLDGGLRRKELILLGGQTGIGKSYLAGQIQYSLAQDGFKTAYFSLEISNEMIVSRLVGSLANIKPTRITSNLLTPEEEDTCIKMQQKLIAHEDYMDFSDDIYDLEVIKQTILENKYDFVVVDFIGNIETRQNLEEKARLKQAARDLQKLAKTQDCCILALSQLSNQMAREKAEKTSNTEFYGSGAIAHAADLAFFIERGVPMGNRNPVTLYLKKNRRGASGITFTFEFEIPGGYIREVQV